MKCQTCDSLKFAVSHERGELGHAKGQLVRVQRDHPENIPNLVAEVEDRKARLAEVEAQLDEHLYECEVPENTGPAPEPRGKLTDIEIRDVRARLHHGETQQSIADLYGVGRSTIAAYVDVQDRGLRLVLDDQPWAEHALCAQTDPESFFPDKGGSARAAKAICADCTVAAECLDYAIDNEVRFGIWGGLSERERRKVARLLEPPSFPCGRGTCTAAFRREVDRTNHYRQTHDRPEATFACPACAYTGRVRQAVTLHIRSQHPELRTAS